MNVKLFIMLMKILMFIITINTIEKSYCVEAKINRKSRYSSNGELGPGGRGFKSPDIELNDFDLNSSVIYCDIITFTTVFNELRSLPTESTKYYFEPVCLVNFWSEKKK